MKVVSNNMAKIKDAFPTLQKGFYDLLCQRLKANEFSDEKLSEAVNHVIDNCNYPNPTIANFINYDGLAWSRNIKTD